LLKKLIKIKNIFNCKLFLDIRSLPVESSFLKKRINYFLLRKNLEKASVHFDGITYITDEMRQYCIKKYNLPKHKSTVWSSGVDVNLFKPQNLNNNNKFKILYHGVISRNRGIQNVIKALSLLKEYEIEFLLLGAGMGTSELKNLVSKLRLENKVKFKTPVSYEEVPEYINSVDAGILPLPEWAEWNTSSPLKLFEYLACGKPVILTKIPAHTNLLDGKDFVFWAETSSSESIASAILQALKNRIHFMNLGKQARNFAKMNYDWEKQLSRLERFITNIQ
jgi:glycosyltransferase involved in cell wall biosynthesis